MTFAVIIAGLALIMYGPGAGAEVVSRIAARTVGGMISATFLALVVIPDVYLLVRKRVID